MIKILTDPPTEEVDVRSRAYYDRISARTNFYRPGRPLPIGTLATFFSMLLGPRILDVGCGNAWYAEYLRLMELEYVGIDLSPGMLARARRRFPDTDFREMNYRDLKFPDESFDAVWFDHGLDTCPKKEVPTLLSEFRRVLKPYGALMVCLPVTVASCEAWYCPHPEAFPEEYIYHALWQEEEVEEALLHGKFSLIGKLHEYGKAVSFFCRHMDNLIL